MDKETLERFKLVLGSNINKPVLEYLEKRLEEVKSDLVSCGTDDIFRRTQGRALELQDIIKVVKSVRENR